MLKLCILSDDIPDSHYLTDAGDFHKVSQDDESFNAQLQDTVPFEFKLKGRQITLALLSTIEIVSVIHDNPNISDYNLISSFGRLY